MDKKLLFLKFIAALLALLCIFYGVYFLPVFLAFMVYLYRENYSSEKSRLKYKTDKIVKLLKIDTVFTYIGMAYLIVILSINNYFGKVSYYVYIPLLICLLPMIYADLYRRRLLKEEEIRDTTY